MKAPRKFLRAYYWPDVRCVMVDEAPAPAGDSSTRRYDPDRHQPWSDEAAEQLKLALREEQRVTLARRFVDAAATAAVQGIRPGSPCDCGSGCARSEGGPG